eukprot:12269742-Alexandrium_andersonii.AAC.1
MDQDPCFRHCACARFADARPPRRALCMLAMRCHCRCVIVAWRWPKPGGEPAGAGSTATRA